MPQLLDHLAITVDDVAVADAFYGAVFGAIGLQRVVELVDEEEDDAPIEATGWGIDDDVLVWIVLGLVPTSTLHVSFKVESQVDVDTFYRDGVDHGGLPRRAPRRWSPYRRGRYSAIVADPWGNAIEVTAPESG